MKLKPGQKAPAFAALDQEGKSHKLRDYLGSWVLLYFYPKDNTPGCTIEACSIRDNFPNFKKVKAVVIGISVDSVASHKKFAAKFKLPFALLSDEDRKIVKTYGVWAKKAFMGKEFMGTKRTSFLIDQKQMIIKIYNDVKPSKHATEVVSDLKTLV